MRRIPLFLAVMTTGISSTCMAVESSEELPKLSLSAVATISKPADEMGLTVGVITLNDTAELALADNSNKMQSIISALEAVGLSKTEYKTGQFSISPTYSPYPKDPSPNWKPSIVGYEVSNSVIIKTQKLDLAGEIIDAASKAGANSFENIHFGLHDPRIYRNEAISQATINAISDAETVALAANVKLLRPLLISLDQQATFAPRSNRVSYAKMASDSTPPIEAGNIDITATVNIVYEIAP